jgi:hypothetical protein
MKGVASVVGRFAAQEFAIRRAYAADPEFREICDDFADAACALARWSGDEEKAADYRQIVSELEEEITEYLAKRYPP